MKEFMSYIEKFLFDIIGILVPGFSIIAFLVYANYSTKLQSLWTCFYGCQFKEYTSLYIVIFVLILYIVGTVVKVLAITQYKLCEAIFDPVISKLKRINTNKHSDDDCLKTVEMYFARWINILIDFIKTILIFKAPSFAFKNIDIDCKDAIKDSLNITLSENDECRNKNERWYKVYKLSTVVIRVNSIPSLTERFLAKYNFYRSMAFVFFIVFIYSTSQDTPTVILIMLFAFWYSFHYKFKRYWTLCGDDAAMTLLYYLKKGAK